MLFLPFFGFLVRSLPQNLLSNEWNKEQAIFVICSFLATQMTIQSTIWKSFLLFFLYFYCIHCMYCCCCCWHHWKLIHINFSIARREKGNNFWEYFFLQQSSNAKREKCQRNCNKINKKQCKRRIEIMEGYHKANAAWAITLKSKQIQSQEIISVWLCRSRFWQGVRCSEVCLRRCSSCSALCQYATTATGTGG